MGSIAKQPIMSFQNRLATNRDLFASNSTRPSGSIVECQKGLRRSVISTHSMFWQFNFRPAPNLHYLFHAGLSHSISFVLRKKDTDFMHNDKSTGVANHSFWFLKFHPGKNPRNIYERSR